MPLWVEHPAHPKFSTCSPPWPLLTSCKEPLVGFAAEGSSSESFTKQLSAGQSVPAFDSHLTTTSSLNPFFILFFIFFWSVDLFSLGCGDVNVRQQQRGEIKGQEEMLAVTWERLVCKE